jgi:mannose-6-phosphate isomerase-like protein (cupin superfamily)
MERASREAGTWQEVIPGFHHKTLAVGDMMSMQAFKIDPTGEYGSKHKHVNAQMMYVTEGEGLYFVEFDEDGENITDEYEVTPGDSIYIPSEAYHNAVNRGDEPVFGIDVFCPPRANATPSYMTGDDQSD